MEQQWWYHSELHRTIAIWSQLLDTMTKSGASGKRKADDPNDGGRAKKKGGSLEDDATTTVPIFLKKTYRMIETCDPAICSWTEDGDTFVVKNPVCINIVYPSNLQYN